MVAACDGGRADFFFNDAATTEIYTLSLHDALPIFVLAPKRPWLRFRRVAESEGRRQDRKSTRLNSSHVRISYAVFCLKKKRRENRWRPGAPRPVRRAPHQGSPRRT